MKLFSKKIKGRQLIILALNILFLAMIAYDLFLVRKLYATLNQEQAYQSIAKITRINSVELTKAVKRYNESVNYILPVVNIADPFALKISTKP